MALRLSRVLSASAVAAFYIGVAAVGCSKAEEGEQNCAGSACIPIIRCDDTIECPPGNYCNTANHECTADCYNDTTCPVDHVCSALGQCISKEIDMPPVIPPGFGGMSNIGGIPNIAGNAGSGGSGGSCVKAEVTFTKQIPNIMLVIDRSGSMEDDFGGEPRWNVLRNALIDPATGLVTDLEDEVRFGLALYTAPERQVIPRGGRGGMTPPPTGGGGGALGNGGSGGGAGTPAATGGTVAASGGTSGASGSAGSGATCPWLIEVPVALNNLVPISAVYLPDDWQNHTPTGESLAVVWPKVAAIDQTLMPGPNFIILATDGEPNMCANDNQREEGRAASVAAITAAKAANITTYVVSVGDDVGQEHLRQLANLGQGLPADDPMDRFYVATDTMGLVSALRQIIVGVRPCEFDLDGTVNLDKASDGTVVIDNTSLTYNDPNGWTLVSDTRIKLQGTACELIREGATQINIDFPCGVFRPKIPQ